MAIDGYIRVSDVGGREGERYAAPSQQRKAIEEAAQRISEPLGEVVIEEDVSGAKRAEDRGSVTCSIAASAESPVGSSFPTSTA